MRHREQFKRWLFDRWIVHYLLIFLYAPCMYRALIQTSKTIGRIKEVLPHLVKNSTVEFKVPERKESLTAIWKAIPFHRGRWEP